MPITRRRFLILYVAGVALAGGCSSPPPPTPAPAKAPEAPKPAATAAPAAPAKPAAPASTAAPAAAPVQQPAAAPKVQPTQGGELVVGLWQEPLSLDPTNANGIALRPIWAMYDTLVMMGDDLKFHPALAESWQAAPDGKSYTFKLKPGVKFHDGTPCNATAVKASLDYVTRTEAKATFSVTLRGTYKESQVVDDLTVRVILNDAFAPFLDALSDGYYGIVSPTAVQKFGKDFDRNPVGTGPFMFQEWMSKSHVALKRNPDYNWGSRVFKHQGPAYLDRVSFRLVPESSTRLATLETGEVLVAEEVPPEDVDRLKKDPSKYQVLSRTYPGGPAQMQLNTAKPPLDEQAVRQAVNYAVDQSELVKVLFQNVYTPARSPMSPGTFGYDESLTKIYKTDPAKARDLLEQAGWKPGSDGIRQKGSKALEFSTNVISDIPITGTAAELIQAQLREVGIKLTIQTMDTAAWNAAVAQGSQMSVIGWRGATDPDFMRPIFHTSFIGKSPLQRVNFRDARMDELLIAGTSELDPTKRAAMYKEVQQIVMNQALIVPLWDRYNQVGARVQVKDLAVDPRGFLRVYDAWIAK